MLTGSTIQTPSKLLERKTMTNMMPYQGSNNEQQKTWIDVRKSLHTIALEMVATGRLQESAIQDLMTILMNDVSDQNPVFVLRAIDEHRKASPFWPHISDLMKYLSPPESPLGKELREMRERRELAHTNSEEFMAKTRQEAIESCSEGSFQRIDNIKNENGESK